MDAAARTPLARVTSIPSGSSLDVSNEPRPIGLSLIADRAPKVHRAGVIVGDYRGESDCPPGS